MTCRTLGDVILLYLTQNPEKVTTPRLWAGGRFLNLCLFWGRLRNCTKKSRLREILMHTNQVIWHEENVGTIWKNSHRCCIMRKVRLFPGLWPDKLGRIYSEIKFKMNSIQATRQRCGRECMRCAEIMKMQHQHMPVYTRRSRCH